MQLLRTLSVQSVDYRRRLSLRWADSRRVGQGLFRVRSHPRLGALTNTTSKRKPYTEYISYLRASMERHNLCAKCIYMFDASHASFNVANTPFAIMRCSTVVLLTFSCGVFSTGTRWSECNAPCLDAALRWPSCI